MRKKAFPIIITFIVCLMIPTICHAQKMILSDGSSWNEIYYSLVDNSLAENYINHFHIEGDTVISGKRYRKIFNNDTLYAAFCCTDTLVYLFDFKTGKEVQQYDFNWYLGKEIIVCNCIDNPKEYHKYRITQIDSIVIYNNEKRAYLPELEWIQGIGSKQGIFSYNDIYGSYGGCGPVLSCLWSGGQLVYKNPFFKYSGSYDIVVPISSGKALFPSEEYFPDIQGHDQHLTFQLTGDSLNISGNIIAQAGGGISLKYEIYEDSIFIEPIADDRSRYTGFWNYPLNVNIGKCNADRYNIFYKGYPHVNTTVSRSDEVAIDATKHDARLVVRTYYNLMGERIVHPAKGVNIVHERYSDGSKRVYKMLKGN